MNWVEAWVDSPKANSSYTYSVPAEMSVQAGDLLTVPFGSQSVGAVALRIRSECPPDLKPNTIRPVQEVVATEMFPASFWPLVEQVAQYYLTPLAQVIRTVLPPGVLNRSQKRIQLLTLPLSPELLSPAAQAVIERLQAKKGDLAWLYLQRQIPEGTRGLQELLRQGYVKLYWQAVDAPQPKFQQAVTLCEYSEEGLTDPQRQVLNCLKRLGGDLWLTELVKSSGSTRQVIQTLARKGRVSITQRQTIRTLAEPTVCRDQPKALTTDQQAAVSELASALGSGQVFLLQGVTGSGKTEVYLQIIATVLQQGKSALVLVPEIGLTPQLTDRFRARFGQQVLVYHSELSTGERYDTWRQMLNPYPQVVIGTRSAIFAPLPQVGIVILDEEHDDSYKQDQPQPCYHARTIARWRSQLESCPLVLGTATPAVETYAETLTGRIRTLHLPERIRAGRDPVPLPPITIIDLRLEFERGNRSMFSQVLQTGIDQMLAQQQQGILFVPRRGYSTFVLCRSCGLALMCPHCDVSLSFHQVGEQLRCHYCGYQQRHPDQCPHCRSPYLKHFGSGTQKVVEALQERWPQLRILRFDSDTTSRKGSHRELLERFRQAEADLLVGTQMLTKGLDVPQVTLVGVIAADGLLNVADFRAAERSFQLLTQVAGRAGRGSVPGQVILQTYLPEHPTLQAVQAYDGSGFLTTEVQHRQESGYPPDRSLVLIRLSSLDPELLAPYSAWLVEQLEEFPAEILGPCPAQVERVSGWFRWQILLKEDPTQPWDRAHLAQVLFPIAQSVPTGIRLSLDVDPLRIL